MRRRRPCGPRHVEKRTMQTTNHCADRSARVAATARPVVTEPPAQGPPPGPIRRRWDRLGTLYDAHGAAVHALAAAVCGPAGADLVTRDVFVELASAVHAFDVNDPGLRAYLLTATYGRAMARARTDPAPPLARLPGDEALAVGLTAFGGLSYRQAGRHLGRSEADVCRDIRSGLRRLRRTAATTVALQRPSVGAATNNDWAPAAPAGAEDTGESR